MSEISCVPHQVEQNSEWDTFVQKSNNGTLFHRHAFLNYHGSRFADNVHHLRFEKKGNLIGILPLGLFDEDGRVAKSPIGASFGGLVCHADCSLNDMEAMVDGLQAYLKNQNVKRLRVVQAPSIYYHSPEDYLDFFLLKNGARAGSSDLTSYIRTMDNPVDGFLARARRDTLKTLDSNLEFSESDNVEEFYHILIENMRKFDGTPTHSQEEVAWLREHLPDDVKIYVVRQDGRAIAGTLLFKANTKTWLVFYWAQCQDATQLHPKNFLVVKLSQLARSEGVDYIDFGPQTLQMEPFRGVTMFKESLGGRGLLRRTYQWELT